MDMCLPLSAVITLSLSGHRTAWAQEAPITTILIVESGKLLRETVIKLVASSPDMSAKFRRDWRAVSSSYVVSFASFHLQSSFWLTDF